MSAARAATGEPVGGIPLRDVIETTTPCPACGAGFTPVRRQRYCTPACRQRAWRARHHDPAPPPVPVPPHTPRRDITVYQCPLCQVRRLGQQWCHDCTRPAVRLDLGGLCPACDEPVAISDLIDTPIRTSPVTSTPR